MTRPDPLDDRLAREMLPARPAGIGTRLAVVAIVALTAIAYALLVWMWLA